MGRSKRNYKFVLIVHYLTMHVNANPANVYRFKGYFRADTGYQVSSLRKKIADQVYPLLLPMQTPGSFLHLQNLLKYADQTMNYPC